MPAYLIMCCQKVLLYSYIMLTFWSFCSAPRSLDCLFVFHSYLSQLLFCLSLFLFLFKELALYPRALSSYLNSMPSFSAKVNQTEAHRIASSGGCRDVLWWCLFFIIFSTKVWLSCCDLEVGWQQLNFHRNLTRSDLKYNVFFCLFVSEVSITSWLEP